MHFLRLIRPINLLIIAITMYSVRFFYFVLGGMEARAFSAQERIDFAILVFSTLLIAAAGNIINDYFDVRADRINRPDRLIVTKYIKRRWAIITHWLFNVTAFLMAAYLSWRYSTFWYMFIHLLSINFLWFYSMHFKRKPFIGNLVVAGLTALVPILCGIHFYLNASFDHSPYSVVLPEVNSVSDALQIWKIRLLKHGNFVYLLAYFAFALNLAREIIKDMQDVEGDKELHARTLPIIWGNRRSAWVAAFILLFSPLFFILLFFLQVQSNSWTHIQVLLPLVVSGLLNVLSVILLLKGNYTVSSLKKSDIFIKLAMLAGILLPYYWWWIG